MGIYLDNASTSHPKPREVADAVYDFMINNGTTSGRGSYRLAMQSDRLIYETRKYISTLFKFNDPKKVIFTQNITESINLVLRGILKEGDHVITSSIEHNAVWRCLKTLERDIKISITKISSTENGYIDLDEIDKSIINNTKIIIINHASNVLGTIQPIKEIGKKARKEKVLFMVDSAQTAGLYPIDIIEDNIDILAFTGHKGLFGPMGTGGLVINCDYDIKPLKSGGTGGESAYEYQPDYYPNKLETGTLNVVGLVGLREGVKYILKVGVDNIYSKEKELIDYTLEKINKIKNIIVYGPKNSNDIVGVITFNVIGKKPEDVAFQLDNNYNIMVRSGLHCCPNAHEIMGTKETGAIRIGIGYFNTKEDINLFIKALEEICND